MSDFDSYNFNNLVRDVSPIFDTLAAERPSLLTLIVAASGGFGGRLIDENGNALPAPVFTSSSVNGSVTNTTYEWIDDQLTPTKTTLTANSNIGVTTLGLASTAGLRVGSILRFTSPLKSPRSVQVQVTAVVSPTSVTVIRPFGGSTDVNLLANDIAYLVSSPLLQGSTTGTGLVHQGVMNSNYTQIFDAVAQLTKTAAASASYDGYTLMANQMNVAIINMLREMNAAAIFGVKTAGSGTTAATAGGLLYYLNSIGGNIFSVGGAISQTIMNDAFESVYTKGGMSNNYVWVGAPNQMRKVTGLNTLGTNPVTFKEDFPNQRLGNTVTTFISDLPVIDTSGKQGGMEARMFIEHSIPADTLLLLDLNYLRMPVMRSPFTSNAAQNGDDVFKIRTLTELTFQVRNSKAAHAVITGLTI